MSTIKHHFFDINLFCCSVLKMIQENHPSMVAAAQKIVQSNTPDPASSTIPRTAAEEVDDMLTAL